MEAEKRDPGNEVEYVILCHTSYYIRWPMTCQPHRLKKTSSMQSKRHDLHDQWLHRETNDKFSSYCKNLSEQSRAPTNLTHTWSCARNRTLTALMEDKCFLHIAILHTEIAVPFMQLCCLKTWPSVLFNWSCMFLFSFSLALAAAIVPWHWNWVASSHSSTSSVGWQKSF